MTESIKCGITDMVVISAKVDAAFIDNLLKVAKANFEEELNASEEMKKGMWVAAFREKMDDDDDDDEAAAQGPSLHLQVFTAFKDPAMEGVHLARESTKTMMKFKQTGQVSFDYKQMDLNEFKEDFDMSLTDKDKFSIAGTSPWTGKEGWP